MNSGKIFWLMVALLAAGFFVFLAFGVAVAPANAAASSQQFLDSGASAASSQPAELKNGVQEVQLTVQGGEYYPNPIRVKKGAPVRLVADLSSVRGCASSIVIPEFGVRKVVRQGDNTIEFTPDKSGTFQFSCSMGMYVGTIIVEEADGTVAAFTGTAPSPAASGGSCGAGGGGCGCGGGV